MKIVFVCLLILVSSLSVVSKESEHSRILFIGDSHTQGPFGQYIDESIRSEGHPLVTIGAASAMIRWYFKGYETPFGYRLIGPKGEKVSGKGKLPLLNDLIKLSHANTLVVALGANYVGSIPLEENWVRQEIRSLITKATEKELHCIWIGPPRSRSHKLQNERVVEILKEETSKSHCRFIDSHIYTSYPEKAGDGIHYNAQDGKNWAETLFNDRLKSEIIEMSREVR